MEINHTAEVFVSVQNLDDSSLRWKSPTVLRCFYKASVKWESVLANIINLGFNNLLSTICCPLVMLPG